MAAFPLEGLKLTVRSAMSANSFLGYQAAYPLEGLKPRYLCYWHLHNYDYQAAFPLEGLKLVLCLGLWARLQIEG